MKIRFAFLLLLAVQVSYGQEYNTYLIEKAKSATGWDYRTNGKILGFINTKDKIDSWWLPPCVSSRKYNAESIVAYPEILDPVKAKTDPAALNDIILFNLKGKKIGYGVINCDGNFIIPPFYTLKEESISFQKNESDRYQVYGQKLKNGNWRIVSFDRFDPSGDIRVYSFPEKKDYNMLNPSMILFKDFNGKYGLMDFHANVLLPAEYDTCYLNFKYNTYPLSSTTETVMKPKYESMPYSFEYVYKTNLNEIVNLYEGYSRGEPNDGHYVYLFKKGDTTLLASSEFITRPVTKGFISAHWFGLTQFYLLKGKGNDFDIINFNGTTPDPAEKYAYYESIKRDTTMGMDRKWQYTKGADYSRPFRAMTVDSIKMAEAEEIARVKRIEAEKKEREYAVIRKIALEEETRLRNDPENYANLIAGTYDVSNFAEHGISFRKTGYNNVIDHYMSIVTGRKNIIYVTIKYKGMRNQWDAQFFTYDISAGFYVTKAADGYILTSPTEGDNTRLTPDNAGALRNVSGFYNPSTSEIEISFSTMKGEQFAIKALKKPN